MFTGIIEATARIQANGGGRLTVSRPKLFRDVKIGSSVCVSGACLTVAKFTRTSMAFDMVEETERKTTLGSLKAGDTVNLERALKASGRFDGHIVQGHVEGVGGWEKTEAGIGMEEVKNHIITVRSPSTLISSIVPKGSITIDGVSLTVTDVTDDAFTVALIPETLKKTTLGSLRSGERVNIETDILARYVSRLLSLRS